MTELGESSILPVSENVATVSADGPTGQEFSRDEKNSNNAKPHQQKQEEMNSSKPIPKRVSKRQRQTDYQLQYLFGAAAVDNVFQSEEVLQMLQKDETFRSSSALSDTDERQLLYLAKTTWRACRPCRQPAVVRDYTPLMQAIIDKCREHNYNVTVAAHVFTRALCAMLSRVANS